MSISVYYQPLSPTFVSGMISEDFRVLEKVFGSEGADSVILEREDVEKLEAMAAVDDRFQVFIDALGEHDSIRVWMSA